MGRGMTYLLTSDPLFGHYHENLFALRYGRCTESPYVENVCWFVTMNHWDEDPKLPHTFIVAEEYARPEVFDRLH